jgi:RNA polymerase sigma-70 factor (ECF subfamily)
MRQHENLLAAKLTAGLSGDQAAYGQFLTELRSALRTHLQKRLAALRQHHLDVEDVVQDTLLAVHRKSHTWDRETPVTAWITAIARYKLIDCMRRSGNVGSEVSLEQVATLIADGEADTETTLALRQAMATLPARMNALLQLVKIEGLSVREAALRTNSSESAVKVNIHRAVKLLRGVIGS